jgi:hypothetical protein
VGLRSGRPPGSVPRIHVVSNVTASTLPRGTRGIAGACGARCAGPRRNGRAGGERGRARRRALDAGRRTSTSDLPAGERDAKTARGTWSASQAIRRVERSRRRPRPATSGWSKTNKPEPRPEKWARARHRSAHKLGPQRGKAARQTQSSRRLRFATSVTRARRQANERRPSLQAAADPTRRNSGKPCPLHPNAPRSSRRGRRRQAFGAGRSQMPVGPRPARPFS